MPTELLPLGMPVTLVANQIYALPAVECVLYTDAVGPTITMSGTVGYAATTAVTLTDGKATLGGSFLRCTTGITIVLRRD